MAESMDADSVYTELAEFVTKLDELREALMSREMLLVDQIEVLSYPVSLLLAIQQSSFKWCFILVLFL